MFQKTFAAFSAIFVSTLVFVSYLLPLSQKNVTMGFMPVKMFTFDQVPT